MIIRLRIGPTLDGRLDDITSYSAGMIYEDERAGELRTFTYIANLPAMGVSLSGRDRQPCIAGRSQGHTLPAA